MITYKDITFCSDDCANYDCNRNMKVVNTDVYKGYMSIASFKDECIGYIKPKEGIKE